MTSLPRWHSNPSRIQQPLPWAYAYSQVQPDSVWDSNGGVDEVVGNAVSGAIDLGKRDADAVGNAASAGLDAVKNTGRRIASLFGG